MLVELRDLSPIRKEVEVEIPADTIRERMGQVAREFSRQARLPGFRQGKAPQSVVLKRFRKDIESEVVDRLLPQFFSEAIRGRDLEPVGDPMLRTIDDLVEGEPLKFVAEFEVKPQFELAEYRGLEITEIPIAVEPEEVDAVLERLRDQASRLRPVEDRAVQKGDVVSVDVVTTGEGIEARTTEGYEFQLGEKAPLLELNEALVGLQPGETTAFEKAYGEEDAPSDEVRGRTIRYEVTLRAIREIERPALNDDFARSMGSEALEQMRERIENDLRSHKEHDGVQSKRRQVGERLNAIHELDVPEVMIEGELAKALREYARYLSSQGVELERAEIDWQRVRDEFRPEAMERAKRRLILEGIARRESLAVSDTEVDAEIRKSAPSGEFSEVRQRLRQDGTYESLRGAMLEEKALQFVLDAARVIRADPSSMPRPE